jgi:hypothetical protein
VQPYATYYMSVIVLDSTQVTTNVQSDRIQDTPKASYSETCHDTIVLRDGCTVFGPKKNAKSSRSNS